MPLLVTAFQFVFHGVILIQSIGLCDELCTDFEKSDYFIFVPLYQVMREYLYFPLYHEIRGCSKGYMISNTSTITAQIDMCQFAKCTLVQLSVRMSFFFDL